MEVCMLLTDATVLPCNPDASLQTAARWGLPLWHGTVLSVGLQYISQWLAADL